MKILVVAEKPSLRRDLERVWPKGKDHVEFANFVGHTMGLKSPDEYDSKWQAWIPGTLPIIPNKFLFKPVDSASKVVSELKTKIEKGHYDLIVNACDAGREGELIFWEFYNTYGFKTPTKRLWAQDTTDEGFKKAIASLVPEADATLKNLQAAAFQRAIMDWLIGMNFTRATSLAMGETINIGRVVTPTLKIIVDRELAISGFKAETYYEAMLSLTKGGITFPAVNVRPPDFKDTHIKSKKDAEAVLSKVKAGVKVDSVSEKENKVYASPLYSLTELQKDANKAYGFTANQTLDIAQKLYEEHKIITYPRTECRYIPKNMIPDIPKKLNVCRKIPELDPYVVKLTATEIKSVLSTKKYVDDAKLTDHHAIVPTNKACDLSKLTDEEIKVYTLICKKLVSIFLGPYITLNTSVTLKSSSGETFIARGKVEKQRGYMSLYGKSKGDVILPMLKDGDIVKVLDKEVLEKQTEPPKRLTDQSLLEAMVNAGSTLKEADLREILKESSGIGTTATRAGIIEKIFDKGWAVRKGKSIYATQKGIDIIQALGARPITSPAVTAEWEGKLRAIEDGKLKVSQVNNELNSFVTTEVSNLLTLTPKDEDAGECPICKGNLIKAGTFYKCSCGASFPTQIRKLPLSADDVRQIVNGGLKGISFTSKEGKPYTADINYVEGKFEVTYSNGNSKTVVGKCPICGSNVIELQKNYICENRDCSFSVGKQIMNAKITEADIKKMLTGRQTAIKKVTTKKGVKKCRFAIGSSGNLEFNWE